MIVSLTRIFMVSLLGMFLCIGNVDGDLIITEFMADSEAVPDSDGEYFELYNSGAVAIDIGSLTIGDDDFNSVDLAAFAGLMINPGSFFVLGQVESMDVDDSHLDLNYDPLGFTMSNGSDEIVVTDTMSGTELARLVYTDGDAPGDGIANVLNNIANAVGGVTQESDYMGEIAIHNTLANGDLGSPGIAGSTVVPEPASILILGLTSLTLISIRRR